MEKKLVNYGEDPPTLERRQLYDSFLEKKEEELRRQKQQQEEEAEKKRLQEERIKAMKQDDFYANKIIKEVRVTFPLPFFLLRVTFLFFLFVGFVLSFFV